MKYSTNKLEQANYIANNGCFDLNCNTCLFITGTCRIYKPNTDPDILVKVSKYIRLEKLKKINDGKL